MNNIKDLEKKAQKDKDNWPFKVFVEKWLELNGGEPLYSQDLLNLAISNNLRPESETIQCFHSNFLQELSWKTIFIGNSEWIMGNHKGSSNRFYLKKNKKQHFSSSLPPVNCGCPMPPVKPPKTDINQPGRKDDAGKRQWGLLPWVAVGVVVDALTAGAVKYGAENWKAVENAEERYFDALLRHIIARKCGEKIDPDSGLPHFALAACNILFLLWFDLNNKVENNEKNI